MAHYKHDLVNASALGELLIAEGLDCDLIDREGKSPLHVAIKRDQLEAIKFAYHTGRFDFNNTLNSSKLSPLHYTVKKAKVDSFLQLLGFGCCNLFLRDSDYQTPKQLALINTAYFKILTQHERLQL